MKLNQDQATEILQMDIETTYKTYLVMTIENPEMEEEGQKAKYGINIEFDIRDHFNQNNKYLNKRNKVMLRDRRLIPITEYRDEIEEREILMKKVILDNLTDDDIIKSGD